MDTSKKIVDLKTFAILRVELPAPIVFTNGCFDILHSGHISILEQASNLGKTLVVGVNSDASVTRLKGPTRPIIPAPHRMRLLAALACTTYIIPFEDDTPLALIKAMNPDILVKGGDWQPTQIVGSEHVIKSGGRVQSLPFLDGFSTTDIVAHIIATTKQ